MKRGPAPHYRHGRLKPYTAAGIRRLKCYRCGERATQQWSICSDGNLHRPLCTVCDVALNELVLEWMRMPIAERKRKLSMYRTKMTE